MTNKKNLYLIIFLIILLSGIYTLSINQTKKASNTPANLNFNDNLSNDELNLLDLYISKGCSADYCYTENLIKYIKSHQKYSGGIRLTYIDDDILGFLSRGGFDMESKNEKDMAILKLTDAQFKKFFGNYNSLKKYAHQISDFYYIDLNKYFKDNEKNN
ncbi:MAG: hypothetical protein PHS92_02765 [Candidatus Gracilibacteria bacterium]|nr:hypothetical protein [Candidatus Gracilibacteria bacterium]